VVACPRTPIRLRTSSAVVSDGRVLFRSSEAGGVKKRTRVSVAPGGAQVFFAVGAPAVCSSCLGSAAASQRNVYLELLRTCDCEGSDRLGGAALWWMAVRPCVFPMTAFAVLIGILLAVPAGPFGLVQGALALLVLIGSLAAHAGNNLLNDYIDVREGIDREGYFRTEYAPHPILSGQLTKNQVLLGAAVLHGLDLVILIILVAVVGWGVAAFALAGLFLSVAYVAPPLSFKRRGLGELTAAVVWGPLMIVGAYYALRGTAPGSIWLLSVPYGILVGAVLVGKHLDKLPQDSAKGVGTLPVRLGAERSKQLVVWLVHLFLIAVGALVITGATGPWVLLALLALPRLRLLHLVYANERPAQPPAGYPVWPLWYVAFAMTFVRTAGGFFVLGLLVNLLVQ
jgi:1,4-dihydroxy-2-naphthoate octaprenyltransferase